MMTMTKNVQIKNENNNNDDEETNNEIEVINEYEKNNDQVITTISGRMIQLPF
jgi:hypothetical protein